MNKELIDYFNGDELAAKVWIDKYKWGDECLPDDSYLRCANEFWRIEEKYIREEKDFKLIYGKDITPITKEWILDSFKNKKICLAGSVFANLGNKNYIGSLSNCFVMGEPHDSYSGIMAKDEQLVQVMKRRGGAGLSLSSLRPKNSKVNNAAKTSTGAVSFANRYSNSTNEVAQSGRRGALMLTMEMRHPDSLEFISSKQDLTKLTGANISVGIRNDFMKSLDTTNEYDLCYPVDEVSSDTYYKTIKSSEYWDKLVECAWKTGEPGILFLDHHWNNSPDSMYPKHRGTATNPCGEIFMSEYDSCRLIHLNIFAFIVNPFTSEAYFDDKEFYEYTYKMQRLADDLIDLEIEAINRIIKHIADNYNTINDRELIMWQRIKNKALGGRRTGSGSLGWADAIAALGYEYGSKESLKIIDNIAKLKDEAESDSTMDMGFSREPFSDYNSNVDEMLRRNISWNTVAPTGTTAIIAQVSAGIEPIFALSYTRNVKVENDKDYDFEDIVGNKFKKYIVYHPTVKTWLELNPDKTIEDSPWYNCTADKIDWKTRVDIQAIIQKYTTHSISSTINLPKNTTKQTISDIYKYAWIKQLKGLTVYVDGSRSGILVTDNNANKENGNIGYNLNAPKRPKELVAHFYPITVKGNKFGVIVGLLEGKPYEIFCMPEPLRVKECIGTITKISKGSYTFKSNNIEIRNLHISGELERAITILTSQLLRHGVAIKHIIAAIGKVGISVVDFSSAIKRVLTKYLPEDIKIECPECGQQMIFENGCAHCNSCGYSRCE